jgi:mono/diheme cytochrome c family protein
LVGQYELVYPSSETQEDGMKITTGRLLGIVLAALLLAACGSAIDSEEPGPQFVEGGPGVVPAEFAELENPLEGDREAIQRGDEAYHALCVQCHGEGGRGEGDAADGMDPPPGNLANSVRMSTLSDGYLYWRISEGGAFAPYNSMMPAWGTLLSETEIWELVSYLRTLPE